MVEFREGLEESLEELINGLGKRRALFVLFISSDRMDTHGRQQTDSNFTATTED